MAYPPDYDKEVNFAEYAGANPAKPYNPPDHDSELANIETTLAAVVALLRSLTRSDGQLANNSIKPEALSTVALQVVTAGWNPRGQWATGTGYKVGDLVEAAASISFVCAADHVSAETIDTDRGSGRWVCIGNGVSAALNDIVNYATQAVAAKTAAVAAKTAAETAKASAEGFSVAAQSSANAAAANAVAAQESGVLSEAAASHAEAYSQTAGAAKLSAEASATSANGAAAAAAAAAASATNKAAEASNSATTAATKASDAATSATAAANSATSAGTSATSAAASAAAATSSYDSFDDRYLGAKSADPATDNDGNALLVGALYWNYVAGQMRVFGGGVWNVAYAPSASYGLFYKADPASVAFVKTAGGAVSIKAGTKIEVSGTVVSFVADTAITMPALTAGTDYAVWVKDDATILASASFSAAPGAGNWRKIGGFHCGLVAAGTTLAGGSFNTAGSPTTGGMVWTQGDVDKIAGINQYSLWDLKFRPACADPRGMVLVGGRAWVDIYLCSTDTAANGTSKAGTDIASGTVLPKIPAAFGGDGTIKYTALNWWVANELARANQKRLLRASEFYDAAFGVTEGQSIDATSSTYPATQRNAGYTSRYGIEQATGVHYTWGQDSAGSASAWTGNGGRGQSYNNSVLRVVLGGARTYGSSSGSRCSLWGNVSSVSGWNLGLRAASDHLQLA